MSTVVKCWNSMFVWVFLMFIEFQLNEWIDVFDDDDLLLYENCCSSASIHRDNNKISTTRTQLYIYTMCGVIKLLRFNKQHWKFIIGEQQRRQRQPPNKTWISRKLIIQCTFESFQYINNCWTIHIITIIIEYNCWWNGKRYAGSCSQQVYWRIRFVCHSN